MFLERERLPPNKRKARLPGPADAKRAKFLQDTVENAFAHVNLTRPLGVPPGEEPTGSILRHRLPPTDADVEDLEEDENVMHGVSIEVTVSPTAVLGGGGEAPGTHTVIGVEEKEERNGDGCTHMGFFME